MVIAWTGPGAATVVPPRHLLAAFIVGVSLAIVGCPRDDDDDAADDDVGDDDGADDDTGGDDDTGDDDDADDDTATDDDAGDDDGDWVQVSVDEFTSCGVHLDGSAECWGDNYWGQAEPPVGTTFLSTAVGLCHTCGLTTEGEVSCWGVPDGDPLDFGQVTESPTGPFVRITSNYHTSCALRIDHSFVCWGLTDWIAMEGEFLQLSLAEYLLCGVRPDGTIECTGANDAGQTETPEGAFVSVAAGWKHACGLRADGSVECWGCQSINGPGACVVPQGYTFVHVEAGIAHTCGLTDEQRIVCWGADIYGYASPPDLLYSQFDAYIAGCGVTLGGGVACWGCDDPDGSWGNCDPPVP